MNARSANPFPRHLPQLDGLRGVAVLLVLAYHLAHFAVVPGQEPNALIVALRFGWSGVDLFFVLSGFLITGILYDRRASSNLIKAFYGRRFLRIAPLYYVALLLYGALVPLFTSPQEAVSFYDALPWHAAYLTNVQLALAGEWSAAPLFTSHLWSLAVEEQFYVVWPAVVWGVVRWSTSPRKALLVTCGCVVVVSITTRLWLMETMPLAAYVLLPARMDALAIGAGLALWARGPQGTRPIEKVLPFVFAWSGIALLAVCVYSAGVRSILSPAQQLAGYTLWACVWASVLAHVAVHPKSRLARGLQIRPLLYTGRISYALYLVHYPILFVAERLGGREWGFAAFAVMVIVASYTLSEISWRLLEAPLLSLKNAFPYSKPAEASLASQTSQPLA